MGAEVLHVGVEEDEELGRSRPAPTRHGLALATPGGARGDDPGPAAPGHAGGGVVDPSSTTTTSSTRSTPPPSATRARHTEVTIAPTVAASLRAGRQTETGATGTGRSQVGGVEVAVAEAP